MANKIRTIPLANKTVCRRIADISVDVKEQVVESLEMSRTFALQLDESTDIADCNTFDICAIYQLR